MHSTRVRDGQNREWVLIHNGDWSGDVIVRLLSLSRERVVREMTIPEEVFREMYDGRLAANMTTHVRRTKS